MRYRIRPLAAAISIAFSTTTMMSAANAQAPQVLEEIKINATQDKALGSTQLSPADLSSQGSRTSDTASLLADVPGVSLYGAGGVSSLPAIHGMADDRVRVKLDGMDLIASCPNHMNPALSYVDPSNIGKLQVYAGISPVSVGGDSIGGTILAETRDPEFAAAGQAPIAKGEVGAFYRSNNDAMGGNVSASYATENFNISYSGATSKADNYKAGKNFKSYTGTGVAGHTLSRDEVGSTAYESTNQTLGLAMKSGNHLFEAKFGFQTMPEQLYPNQRMDLLENDQKRLNLRYLGRFDWGKLEARAYHERVDHFMDFGADKRFWYGTDTNSGINGVPCAKPSPTCAFGMPMYTESKTSGVSLKADIAASPNDLLRVGAEMQRYSLDDWWPASGGGMWPGSFWNVKDGKRDRNALFGEWEAQRGTQWTTLLGARYEHVKTDAGDAQGYNPAGMGNQGVDANNFNRVSHSRSDNNWDLTALARYAASSTLDVDLGFARKVRSPNLHERYTWSTWSMAAVMNNFVGDGNGYVGNVDLKPETAHTISSTFDWHSADRSSSLKITPYYTRVSDYIDAVRLTANVNQFNVLRFTNQSARLYGVDVSGNMPLASSSMGAFGLKGLLAYTNGKNRDTGDDLYNIMPLNAKLILTHKTGGWDNSVEVLGVKAKNKVSDSRNEIETSGYSLVNLRASHSWKQVRIDFGIENLFDRHYYLPTGGAYLGQGRTMSINPPAADGMFGWGTAVPGMGRSLYAGINVKF